MKSLNELTNRIAELAKEPEDNFLELARALGELHSLSGDIQKEHGKTGELFANTIKKFGLSKRKAYYLLEINRAFCGLKLSPKRLRKIGWTKLVILAGCVDVDNYKELLSLAEKHTADELRAKLKDEEPRRNYMTLKFTDAEFSIFGGALLVNGGYISASGAIANKEKALLRIVKLLHKAQKMGFIP